MDNKDPFGERRPVKFCKTLRLLGSEFEFTSDSARLLSLVTDAYARLPRHRLSARAMRFHIRLQLTSGQDFGELREPPRPRTLGDGNILSGIVDAANFAILCPALRTGLVAISREMLRFPYHARYELLEFAVFTLATRSGNLAPLHAGCIGSRGNGLLLIGESGAGKSTLALHCLSRGMELLAEDAVFVEPGSLLGTGVANYLHLRADTLRFIDDKALAARIRRSPLICRRSGVEKFEVDVRGSNFRSARSALKIAGVIFVTPQPAAGCALLRPIGSAEARKRFVASQPYAAQLPGGRGLMKQLAHLGTFELRRPSHPAQAAEVLKGLLQWGQKRRR